MKSFFQKTQLFFFVSIEISISRLFYRVYDDAKIFNGLFFIESFPQMCLEGKWLQNRLRADKNESRSLSAVDIQGTNVEVSAWSPMDYETLS